MIIFQGRMLHILPGKEKMEASDDITGTYYPNKSLPNKS